MVPGLEQRPLVLLHLCSCNFDAVLEGLDTDLDGPHLTGLPTHEVLLVFAGALVEKVAQFHEADLEFAEPD